MSSRRLYYVYSYSSELNGKKTVFRIETDENRIYLITIDEAGISPHDQETPESETMRNAIAFFDLYFSGKSGITPSSVELHQLSKETEMEIRFASPGITLKLDITGFTPKQAHIYTQLAMLPFGETISYGELARSAGCSRGGRFAGNTMASNRFPVIIPCHRVISSDGSIGGFSSSIEIKRDLLLHESPEVRYCRG